jgi:catecholate siderophore receptor
MFVFAAGARITVAVSLACALVVPAAGQTRQDTRDDCDEIIVNGMRQGYAPTDTGLAKIPVPLRDIPQSIAVVGAPVLLDQRALSLQDALKNVPGVSFAAGDGQRDQVNIRGFTAIADQFVNGFRDDALYFSDLSNTERVEVVKGPAAVLYGRGSSGGADQPGAQAARCRCHRGDAVGGLLRQPPRRMGCRPVRREQRRRLSPDRRGGG